MYGRGYGGGGGMRIGPPVTPPIIKQLLIANCVVFVLQHVIPGLSDFGAVRPYRVFQEGWFWQPATYMWLHAPNYLSHIGFNMLALWMFGTPIALAWGPKKFLQFYLICGVGAGILIAIWPYIPVAFGWRDELSLTVPTLGASGAVFGVLLAYSLTWPDRTIMLIFPPIPIKAIYFIPFILAMGLLMGPRNVSHTGHLGGVLVGWLLLRREGRVGNPLSLDRIKYRIRRWRMRRRLQAVRNEEARLRRRDQNDRTLH